MSHRPSVITLLWGILCISAAADESGVPVSCEGLPLPYATTFDNGAAEWQPTDPNVWKVREVDGENVYAQFKSGDYRGPYRSPFNISLLKAPTVGDFVLKFRALSTDPAGGGHRDLCVFFGWQDPASYYYAHLGQVPDPHSSQILIVNGAPRKMITTNTPPGIPWNDQWHEVKVVRRVVTGKIEVYFDDMDKPNMVATDKTFPWGCIGLGSFDNHGLFDNVRLYGEERVDSPRFPDETIRK